MNDELDPIIDSCLDEVLGGRKPPDLTERILRALEERRLAESLLPTAADAGAVTETPPVRAVISSSPTVTRASKQLSAAKWSSRTWSIAFAGGLALAIIFFATIFTAQSLLDDSNKSDLTNNSVPRTGRVVTEHRNRQREIVVREQPAPTQENTLTESTRTNVAADDDHRPEPAVNSVAQSGVNPSKPASSDSRSVANHEPTTPGHAVERPQGSDLVTDQKRIDGINAWLATNWAKHNVTPTPHISDSQWCDRAFRTVIGRPPTPDEWKTYVDDSSPERKRELLADLLYSDQYAEEFSRHWGEYWASVFLDADTLVDNNLANRDGMLQYFRRSLLDKRSFNWVVAGLLTATGSGVPGAENYDGAANFLLARADKDHLRVTADVSRLILGRNIECQQCHDGPHFGSGKQDQFWELNAFFRQLAVERHATDKNGRLVDVDFAGASGSGEVYYELPNTQLKIAYPVFVDGTAINQSGKVAEVNRRAELAKLITKSSEFHRNITNRVWSAVLGRGLVDLEQIARDGKLSCPEPLAQLGDQFALQGYDVRRLILWTALSEPFQLAGGNSLSVAVSKGDPPLFDRFYEERPRSSQNVHDVLLTAAKDFGRDPLGIATTAKVDTLPNAINKDGKVVLDAPASPNALFDPAGVPIDPMLKAVLSNSKLTAQQKTEHLFQMALHRQPRAREVAVVEEILKKAGDNPQLVWQTIWAALNSGVR